jgi:hypothetical protein
MPLSVNFRWKTPTLQAPQSDAEKNNLNENLMQVGRAIADMKASRYRKQQDERRNKIEDEKNRREWEEQDRKKQAQLDTAEMIRKKSAMLSELKARRQQIASQIEALKAQLGG